jgi:hypothetical protein
MQCKVSPVNTFSVRQIHTLGEKCANGKDPVGSHDGQRLVIGLEDQGCHCDSKRRPPEHWATAWNGAAKGQVSTLEKMDGVKITGVF